MKSQRFRFILISLFLFSKLSLMTFYSIAQSDNPSAVRFYASPKLGMYLAYETFGFGGGAEIGLLSGKTIYSIEYYRQEEFALFFGHFPPEEYNQFGIMIGKYKGDGFFRFQYQGGFGPVWGVKTVDRIVVSNFGETVPDYDFFAVGLLTKLGFKIVPLPFFSFGFDLQSNLNLQKFLLMPMISFELGKLRNRINAT